MFKGSADSIFNNVPDYAHAQLTASPVIQYNSFMNIFQAVTLESYFNAPIGHFHFPSTTDDQKTQLASYGLNYDPASKLFVGVPQAAHIRDIMGMGAKNGRSVPGGASCYGFLAYTFALKAMKIFSFVSGATLSNRVNVRTQSENTHGGWKNCSELGKRGGSLLANPLDEDFVLPILNTEPWVLSITQEEPFFPPLNTQRNIPNSHFNPTTNRSSFSCGGLLFPYFLGMMLPDRDFAVQIFQRFFFRGLSTKPQGAQQLWTTIKQGLRNISVLPAGMAISHAFLGMMLADNTKSCIRYVIDKGQYHGFILLGDHINIINNNRVHAAAPPEDLFNNISTFKGIDISLIKLISVLSTAINNEGDPRYVISLNDINTSRGLFNVLRTIDTDYFERDAIQEVDNLLSIITYGETYASPTTGSIASFLSYVSSGDMGILSQFPTLLTGGIWRSPDRITIGLGIFGGACPTLSWAMGHRASRIPIPKPGAEGTLVTKDGAYPFMPVKTTTPAAAQQQWTHVLAQGEILLPVGRSGKKEKYDLRATASITGTAFTKLFLQLQHVVEEHRQANIGKRKRGMEDEGPSAKKGKERAVEGMDISDL